MVHRLCCFLQAMVSLTNVTLVIFSALLISCSSGVKQWNPDDYTVKSGDTVYAIAWRYELDPEAFATWNGIDENYFIKPGQRLHTRKPDNFDVRQVQQQARDIAYAPAAPNEKKHAVKSTQNIASGRKWVKAHKGDTLYGISRRSGVSIERLAQLNQLKKPYTLQPGQTIYLKPIENKASSTKTTLTKNTSRNKSVTARKTVPAKPATTMRWPKKIRWQKPAKGKVVKKFSRRGSGSKGIDIAARTGSPIVASASGKVVYSGDGLISYGNLIIIKHNKTYLSAYAYNRKLLVKEGDVVKAGQKIAEMGHKDKRSPRLHFEIRKNGKPVNPLKYLPY